MARTWDNKLDDIANINMMIQSIAADPLQADPHAPVKVPKDQPGSSPWLPGKSPAPSRQQWVKNNNNNDMKISNINYGPPSELDKWLQLYQGPGGTLRHIKDPDMRKLILQRGLMKAQGGNPFSTDALDKQKQIRDYLNNDQKVKELLIRQGKMKA